MNAEMLIVEYRGEGVWKNFDRSRMMTDGTRGEEWWGLRTERGCVDCVEDK